MRVVVTGGAETSIVERLRSLYGWVPSTPFGDGLRAAVEWMRATASVGRKA